MPKEILLQLKNVHVHYGGVKALDGVDVAIDEGEIVALMGPNGAGKSTILKSIFRIGADSFRFHFCGMKAITPLSYEMARMGIVFVPQGRRVFAHLTVMENLELGAFLLKKTRRIKNKTGRVAEYFSSFKGKN